MSYKLYSDGGVRMVTAALDQGGKRVGYIRVSSLDQNEVRQLDCIELNKIFTDKASGKDTKRTQLQACLDYLRDGDCAGSSTN